MLPLSLLHLDPLSFFLRLDPIDVPVAVPVDMAVGVRGVDAVGGRWRMLEVAGEVGERLAQLLVQEVAVVLQQRATC